MIVKFQKQITFINKCQCIFDEKVLVNAILWFSQDRPVARLKTIFLYGKYPAISIYEKKVHIHRLITSYIFSRELDINEYVHHVDGNRLNASSDNLLIINASKHQRGHLSGKKQSQTHIQKRIRATTLTRYGH